MWQALISEAGSGKGLRPILSEQQMFQRLPADTVQNNRRRSPRPGEKQGSSVMASRRDGRKGRRSKHITTLRLLLTFGEYTVMIDIFSEHIKSGDFP